ncbi:glycosyltransferase [bacterium]|nr:glycosyltransferase [bacterium]
MATHPTTSVILPVYNGMPHLPLAVESVLQQGIPFELKILDDGSTDGSREYLRSLSDPRVQVVENEATLGLFGNLNAGIALAQGRFIRILCQDDILEKGCLDAEAAFLDAHDDVALSFCKYRLIDVDGKLVSETALGDLPEVLSPQLASQHFFYHGCLPGNLSTVCVRASVLRGFGGFDTSFRVSGDYDLWSRISARYPLGILHERQVQIRSHRGQLSRAPRSVVPFIRENARVRSALRPYLPEGLDAQICRFETRRHRVLDFHQALHCVLAGRFSEARAILLSIGPDQLLPVFWAWLTTLNNRRRPQAPWVL